MTAEEITEAAWNAARQRAIVLLQRGGCAGLDEAIATYEWLRSGTPRAEPALRAVVATELSSHCGFGFEQSGGSADPRRVAHRDP
jgi:hypothetical protein